MPGENHTWCLVLKNEVRFIIHAWDINKQSRTSLSTGIRSKQALNSFQCWKRNAPRNRWNPSTNGTLISLDRALDNVLISIHGIIINFESRLLWSREDKSMHTSSFCAQSTEKSFHDSWSFISGTGLCTFPAQPRRRVAMWKRDRERKQSNRKSTNFEWQHPLQRDRERRNRNQLRTTAKRREATAWSIVFLSYTTQAFEWDTVN